jgi:transcription elongation GreA/GreB family factor
MNLQSYKGARITPEGKAMYEARRTHLEQKLRRSITENADRGPRKCGETGNGVTAEDDVTRQHKSLRDQILDITILLRDARLVLPATSCKVAAVGTVITLLHYEHDEKDGGKTRDVRQQLLIVGYGEGDCDSVPRRVSYNSPLVAPFIGQSVGFQEEILLENGGAVQGKKAKSRVHRLTAIRLPVNASK